MRPLPAIEASGIARRLGRAGGPFGASSGGHGGVVAGGLQSVSRRAEAVGGGRDGTVLAAVQDGQFGLLGFEPAGQSDGIPLPQGQLGGTDQRGDDGGGRPPTL
jgi:hypothetical protein